MYGSKSPRIFGPIRLHKGHFSTATSNLRSAESKSTRTFGLMQSQKILRINARYFFRSAESKSPSIIGPMRSQKILRINVRYFFRSAESKSPRIIGLRKLRKHSLGRECVVPPPKAYFARKKGGSRNKNLEPPIIHRSKTVLELLIDPSTSGWSEPLDHGPRLRQRRAKHQYDGPRADSQPNTSRASRNRGHYASGCEFP